MLECRMKIRSGSGNVSGEQDNREIVAYVMSKYQTIVLKPPLSVNPGSKTLVQDFEKM